MLTALFSGLIIADEYRIQRMKMIYDIEDDVHMTARYINKESLNDGIMNAMKEVPCHEFVPAELHSQASDRDGKKTEYV